MEKVIEYKGYTIKVVEDSDPFDPREECDNFGTMVFFHRRYRLGDENKWDPQEFKEYIEKGEKNNRLVALPVYMYDHSGITIKTSPFSDPWDSGLLGWIYVDREKILKEYDRKILTKSLRRKAEETLRGEVQTYDNYLRGDVYGYQITDSNQEELESCYGYYGDPEESGCISDAKNIIDHMISKAA